MAFTFSISSSKIDVLTGTGTLAELYTDAIADTAGCMTSPSANVYQVEGNRELELSSGVTVTTADGDTLQWALTANTYPILHVATGSVLNLTQNTKITGDTDGTHYSYIYIEGECNANGTAGNEVIFELYRSIYIYGYENVDWDHVILRDNVLSSGYMLFFQPDLYNTDQLNYTRSFDNITIQGGPTENANNGWIFFYGGDYSTFTFNNIDITDTTWAFFYGCSNLTINGGTATSTNQEHRMWNCGGPRAPMQNFEISKTKLRGIDFQNQPKFYYKNYTFDANDAGVYTGPYVDRGTVIYVEDCTFKNATYGMRAQGGIIVLLGTQTYTSITTEKIWGPSGTILHGRKLTLSVEDSGAAAIADATVTIRQKEGNEFWQFRTDSNGDVLDPRGEPIVLIEKEETSTGVFDQWSDGTGNQVHIIEVYKDGYEPHSEEVAMNQDRTKTIVLSTETQSGTTLNNVTINSTATIY